MKTYIDEPSASNHNYNDYTNHNALLFRISIFDNICQSSKEFDIKIFMFKVLYDMTSEKRE